MLLLVGAFVLAHLTRGSTFYADEWDWILNRRHGGLGAFLAPHQQHLSLVPLVVYRLLFALWGIHSYGPYLAAVIAAQLTLTALVFRYALVRIGLVFALLVAALVLFLGPGSIDFLWAFQMAWVFTMVCAVGGLLALDRDDLLGDVIAALLMAAALATAGPGLAVAVGLAVEMVWTRGRRGLWMAGVPLGLFALWWILYQQAGVLAESAVHVPAFMASAAAASVSALTGLLALDPTSDTTTFRDYGPVLALAAVIGLAWRLRATAPVAPRTVALLVMVLAFWLITGIGRGAFQAGVLVLSETGDESRYVYIGAVLLIVLVVELAQDFAPSPGVAAGLAVLLLSALASNFGALRQQAQYLRSSGADTAAYLGTLDMTRGVVAPGFPSAGFLLGIVDAGAYFAAERELGSPAWSSSRLAVAADGVRQAADHQLIAIHGVTLTAPTAAQTPTGCRRVSAASTPGAVAGPGLAVTVPASGVEVQAAGAPATVALRRFSSQFETLGTIAPGARAVLRIGPDGVSQPWQLLVTPTGDAAVCALRS
ncbi:MAG: hypothetical protein QOG59_2204 [Solirubrobacteraceae bacterium]|nr:hypothetical protein [Solirubrobacteraceae bacterium]